MKAVAVILSTYNGEKYIKEQLESLKNQTYSNLQVFIHDDGSTDKTVSIIKEYVNDSESKVKFLLVDQKNLRYPKCFIKTLLDIPRADYYAFCDQDDVWFEDKITKAVEAMKQFGDENEASLVYSAVDYYDENLNYIRGSRFLDKSMPKIAKYSLQSMLLGGEAMGMTFLFNNKLREFMQLITTEGQEDFKDTFMKIYCAACGTVIYIQEPSAKYRRHPGATTVGMNPASKLGRLINMSRKIFIDKDGMDSIQSSVNYIAKHHIEDVKNQNLLLVNVFAEPNSWRKRVIKFFWQKRFRLKLIDEAGYRLAFLLGKI